MSRRLPRRVPALLLRVVSCLTSTLRSPASMTPSTLVNRSLTLKVISPPLLTSAPLLLLLKVCEVTSTLLPSRMPALLSRRSPCSCSRPSLWMRPWALSNWPGPLSSRLTPWAPPARRPAARLSRPEARTSSWSPSTRPARLSICPPLTFSSSCLPVITPLWLSRFAAPSCTLPCPACKRPWALLSCCATARVSVPVLALNTPLALLLSVPAVRLRSVAAWAKPWLLLKALVALRLSTPLSACSRPLRLLSMLPAFTVSALPSSTPFWLFRLPAFTVTWLATICPPLLFSSVLLSARLPPDISMRPWRLSRFALVSVAAWPSPKRIKPPRLTMAGASTTSACSPNRRAVAPWLLRLALLTLTVLAWMIAPWLVSACAAVIASARLARRLPLVLTVCALIARSPEVLRLLSGATPASMIPALVRLSAVRSMRWPAAMLLRLTRAWALVTCTLPVA
ncbi:hypothetical protein [Pseudomonas sp. 25 E 4]|nr:hypothetical protein [Pseudomonas sp. 25 E 4]